MAQQEVRLSKLSTVLGKLQKQYKEAIVNVQQVGTISRIRTDSPSLNFIFGGGFGMGRIYEFSGPESGGKSTLATYIGGQIQKKNTDRPIVVYVDFEYSFDETYANTLGLSTDQDTDFVFLRPTHGEEAFTLLRDLIVELPVGLIIIDSLATTPSIAQVEDPNKACVSPDTPITFFVEREKHMQTMQQLFESAGYNYNDMEPYTFYPVEKNIKIQTLNTNTGDTEFARVNSLVYKGTGSGYWVVVNDVPVFSCTRDHKFYEVNSEEYITAAELYPNFIGASETGDNIEVSLIEMEEEFPVLDLEVDEFHTYLSGGLLSHNTFGGTAKVYANGLKFINPYLGRYDTSMIVINQERANIGSFGPGPAFSTTGGYAIKYYASWRGRITRVEDIKEKGLTVGIVSKVRNQKNKIGIPKREALLELKFESGFDSEKEYLQFIVDLGIVTRKGAWFENEEWNFRGQGRDSVREFLVANPELFEQVKNTVNALMNKETVLDAQLDNEDDDVPIDTAGE